MEKLQGPIPPYVECLEQGFGEEEEEALFSTPSLEERMSFLQMLQCVESPQHFDLREPNFQTLLRLQHLKKPWELSSNPSIPQMETQIQALELESCVTHEILLGLHSPVRSETKDQDRANSTMADNCSRQGNNLGSSPLKNFPKSPPVAKEPRKGKRTKVVKNKEVESQRMTHIAVERNRRRQMNDYLSSLRSLLPPYYIQRGDQASIIGGAIDFVKELEQLLQSLEAQKRMREFESNNISDNSVPKPAMEPDNGDEVNAEIKSGAAEIEVNVINSHVNLKIQCSTRAGQLVQAIVTLESFRLTVLHLNITTSQASVLYSFNLQMEDDSELRSADEIAAAVHQIFS